MYYLTDSFEVAACYRGRENGCGSTPPSDYNLKPTLSIIQTCNHALPLRSPTLRWMNASTSIREFLQLYSCLSKPRKSLSLDKLVVT